MSEGCQDQLHYISFHWRSVLAPQGDMREHLVLLMETECLVSQLRWTCSRTEKSHNDSAVYDYYHLSETDL